MRNVNVNILRNLWLLLYHLSIIIIMELLPVQCNGQNIKSLGVSGPQCLASVDKIVT